MKEAIGVAIGVLLVVLAVLAYNKLKPKTAGKDEKVRMPSRHPRDRGPSEKV